MSYFVWVAREAWDDARSDPIPPDEWAPILDADPHLAADEDSTESSPCYVWTAHPERPHFTAMLKGKGPAIRHRDPATYRKLLLIADRMGGFVEGEHGERYRLTPRGIEQYHRDPADGEPCIICD